MQDHDESLFPALSLPWLAQPVAALTQRMAHPAAQRLTEEQEALAMGIVRRLVVAVAERLPVITPPNTLWREWETRGLPVAAQLAPAIFARVEEYRWRSLTGPAIIPATTDAATNLAGVAATLPDETGEPASAIDQLYLNLRIVDARRLAAPNQPLLPIDELTPDVRRALLVDVAGLDLALGGDAITRAPMLSTAMQLCLQPGGAASISVAGAAYVAALKDADLLAVATASAMRRNDWLALIAIVANVKRAPYSDTATWLLGAETSQLTADFGAIGVDLAALPSLLAARDQLPARSAARRDHAEGSAPIAGAQSGVYGTSFPMTSSEFPA